MKITVKNLRSVIDVIMSGLEADGIDTIEISDDYYWHLPKDKAYNPYEEPNVRDYSLGQLSDDWEVLMSLLTTNEDLGHVALIKLAPLLRNIGEKAYLFEDGREKIKVTHYPNRLP